MPAPEWRLEAIDEASDRITLWIGAQPLNFHANQKWKLEMIIAIHAAATFARKPMSPEGPAQQKEGTNEK